MAIAFRAVGTGGNGTGGPATVTPAKPAGTASTDILVAILCFGGGTAVVVTPPSGWTLVKRTDNGTTNGAAAYWALGSVASLAFGLSGVVDAVSAIVAGYTGVDNATPMDATGVGQSNAASTTVTSPSITTVTANAQIVFLGAPYDAARGTPGTWTTVFGTVRGNTGIRGASVDSSEVVIADAAQAATGASGTKTETYSLSLPSVGILAALRPTAAAAADPGPPPRRGPPRRPGSAGDALTRFRSPGAFPATSTVQNLLQSLAGSLSSSGAIVKQANASKAGTLTDSGALLKQPATSKAGTLTDSGALLKQAQKPLAGNLTSSATLTAIKIVLLALAGTLTSTGALLKQALAPLSGTLTSAGALTKLVGKILSCVFAPAGALLKRVLKALAGTLSSSATLVAIKIVLKSLAGTLTSSGAVARLAGKALSGALAPVGAVVKRAGRTMAGSLSSSGVATKIAAHLFVGTLSFVGALIGVPVVVAVARSDGTDRFLAWLQLRAGFHRGR